MIQTIVTAAILYIATKSRFISDFINIFARAKTKKRISRYLYWFCCKLENHII
jgi:cadmium resistance protein CadD (predicted permease)